MPKYVKVAGSLIIHYLVQRDALHIYKVQAMKLFHDLGCLYL